MGYTSTTIEFLSAMIAEMVPTSRQMGKKRRNSMQGFGIPQSQRLSNIQHKNKGYMLVVI